MADYCDFKVAKTGDTQGAWITMPKKGVFAAILQAPGQTRPYVCYFPPSDDESKVSSGPPFAISLDDEGKPQLQLITEHGPVIVPMSEVISGLRRAGIVR